VPAPEEEPSSVARTGMAHRGPRTALVRPHAAARSAVPAPRAPRSRAAALHLRLRLVTRDCTAQPAAALAMRRPESAAHAAAPGSRIAPRPAGIDAGHALRRPHPRPHRPGVAADTRAAGAGAHLDARRAPPGAHGRSKCGSPVTVDSYRRGVCNDALRGASGRRRSQKSEDRRQKPEDRRLMEAGFSPGGHVEAKASTST